MRKKVLAVLLILSLMLGIGACGKKLEIPTEPSETSEPSETPSSSETASASRPAVPAEIPKSYPVPKENRIPADYSHGVASTQSDGYYGKAGIALTYYDAESDKKVFLCDQPGCIHADETCKAYMGGYPSSLLEYRGMVYASVYETPQKDGDSKLIQKNPETGEIKVIVSFEATETEQYRVGLVIASDGLVMYSIHREVIGSEEDIYPSERFFYDTELGESVPYPLEWNGRILGLSRDYVVIDYRNQEKIEELRESGVLILDSLEEGILTDASIRRYDLHTGEYKDIVTAKDHGYVYCVEDCCTYGDLTIVRVEGCIYLYDMEKDELREFLKNPDNKDYVNCWLSDGKVFALASTAEKELNVYYSEIDDPRWCEVDNRGYDAMLFSTYGEIDSMFYGLYHGVLSLIPKADFYAGNYEAAHGGGG